MSTKTVKGRTAKKRSFRKLLPHLEDFLLLALPLAFELFRELVGEFLDFAQRSSLVVFGNLFLLQKLLQTFVGVPANVADRSPVVLEHLVNVFYQFLPPLLRQRRDGHSQHLSVVHPVQSPVGRANDLPDRPEQAWG